MSQSDAGTPPGMPRWVKAGVIVVCLLVLLFVVLVLTGVHDPGGPGHVPGMLAGVVSLAFHRGPERPAPGDRAAADVTPSVVDPE